MGGLAVAVSEECLNAPAADTERTLIPTLAAECLFEG